LSASGIAAEAAPTRNEEGIMDAAAGSRFALWEESISDLVAAYRDIERRRLWLPAVSFYPALVGLWASFKCTMLFLLDLIVFIPLNLLVFLRNLLPGRWSYR
jgi:hypothetical protein